MATTDDVLRAVQRLTKDYETLQEEVTELRKKNNRFVPLYKNGRCDWDGYENLTADSELYSRILTYGGATKAIYSSSRWNNAFMITLGGIAFAEPKSGFPDKCCVFKVPLNNLENVKKTFFWKACNSDSYAYGYASAYLCEKDTLRPYKFLGTNCPLKSSGEGKSATFDMFNGEALQTRYHEWLTFNFNLDDCDIDDDNNVYIGISSTVANIYTSGWGIADRNFDTMISPIYCLINGSNPMTAKPTATSTNSGNLATGYFARATSYVGFEIPYNNDIEGDLLVSFSDSNVDAIYVTNMLIKGNASGTYFTRNCVNVGHYGSLVKSGGVDVTNLQIVSFIVPKVEREQNTIIKNGQKYLSVDIPIFYGDRNFVFSHMYTEEYEGI